jgi:hypothetical protein
MRNKAEKRCIIACKVLWREISYFAASSPFYYDVFYLEQGLHDEPARLRQELQEKITELEESYPVILIGYGLCSNGIVGIKSRSATLVFMRGHDCITFFLGSKERYRRIFDEWPGTYWYTTGWIETSGILNNEEYYYNKYKEYLEKYDEDTAQYLIDSRKLWFKNYKNIAFIQEKITEETEFKKITKNAAAYSELDYKEIDGDMELIRDWIHGNWGDDRFLILVPDQVVAASFIEETIIQGDRIHGL